MPTLRELGDAQAVAYGWQGISVPTGTPAPTIQRLNQELIRAMQSEELSRRTRDLGIETPPLSIAEFNAFVARENAEWRPLIRDLGIRIDS